MSNQDHPIEFLPPLVAGELDQETEKKVRAHLLVCSHCLNQVEDLRALCKIAPEIGASPSSADIPSRVMAAIRREVASTTSVDKAGHSQNLARKTTNRNKKGN